MVAGTAQADTFNLSHGRRYELCRAYEQNLKSFPDLSSTTHIWPLDSKLSEFRHPEWKSVDALEHLDIVRTMYLWSADPQSKRDDVAAEDVWKEKAGAVLQGIKSGSVRLDRTRVDFGNDGHLDTVYRYYHPLYAGAPKDRYGYWYLFFRDGSDEPSSAFRKYSGDMRLYDSFLFRGRFYLMRWDILGLNIIEPRSVRAGAGIALIPVCIFGVSK